MYTGDSTSNDVPIVAMGAFAAHDGDQRRTTRTSKPSPVAGALPATNEAGKEQPRARRVLGV